MTKASICMHPKQTGYNINILMKSVGHIYPLDWYIDKTDVLFILFHVKYLNCHLNMNFSIYEVLA